MKLGNRTEDKLSKKYPKVNSKSQNVSKNEQSLNNFSSVEQSNQVFASVCTSYALVFLLSAILSWISGVLNGSSIINYTKFLVYQQALIGGKDPFYLWLTVLIAIFTLWVLGKVNGCANFYLKSVVICLFLLVFSYSVGYYHWLMFLGNVGASALFNIAIMFESLCILVKLNKLDDQKLILYLLVGLSIAISLFSMWAFKLTIIGVIVSLVINAFIACLFVQLAKSKYNYGPYNSLNVADSFTSIPRYLVLGVKQWIK